MAQHRRRRVDDRSGGTALRILAFAILSLAVLAACSPFTPKGWSPKKQCGPQGNCWSVGSSPDNGSWLGFHIGMNSAAAIKAGCDAAVRNHVKMGGFSLGTSTRRCALDRRWLRDSMWFAESPEFWCLNGGAFVSLAFDKKTDHLKRIAAYCKDTFDP